jgi:hypothetical protein
MARQGFGPFAFRSRRSSRDLQPLIENKECAALVGESDFVGVSPFTSMNRADRQAAAISAS